MDAAGRVGAAGAQRFAMIPSRVARMPVAPAPLAALTPPVTPTPAVTPMATTAVGMPALAPPSPGAAPAEPRTRRSLPSTVVMARSKAVPASRPAIDLKRPYHLGVALGLSAGVYAGSLAAVSMLQFEHDRALIADRAPVREAIELLGRNHDAMAANLERAGAAFEDASAGYAKLATGLETLHADVVGLSDTLATINRLAAIDASGLGGAVTRGGIRSPTVARSASKPATTSAPPSGATTGASGAP